MRSQCNLSLRTLCKRLSHVLGTVIHQTSPVHLLLSGNDYETIQFHNLSSCQPLILGYLWHLTCPGCHLSITILPGLQQSQDHISSPTPSIWQCLRPFCLVLHLPGGACTVRTQEIQWKHTSVTLWPQALFLHCHLRMGRGFSSWQRKTKHWDPALTTEYWMTWLGIIITCCHIYPLPLNCCRWATIFTTWSVQCPLTGLHQKRRWVENSLQHPNQPLRVPSNAIWSGQYPCCLPDINKWRV